jgi:hypothetical protein
MLKNERKEGIIWLYIRKKLRNDKNELRGAVI